MFYPFTLPLPLTLLRRSLALQRHHTAGDPVTLNLVLIYKFVSVMSASASLISTNWTGLFNEEDSSPAPDMSHPHVGIRSTNGSGIKL